MLFQSKYKKLTALSDTLQEDPSCQLMTVLRRYIRQAGVESIDANLSVNTVPQILTIKRGLLALTRSWKHLLHMPILADSSFKNKKRVQPYTVTFAMPKEDSIDNFQFIEDGESHIEHNYELIDEKTSLLRAEGFSTHGESISSFADAITAHSQPDNNQGTKTTMPLSASANQLHTANNEGVSKGVSTDSVLQPTSEKKIGNFFNKYLFTSFLLNY